MVNDVPYLLKISEAAVVLGVSIGTVRALGRSGEIELLRDPAGAKIRTQSLIEYLGRVRFKELWPCKMGKVVFEEKGKSR